MSKILENKQLIHVGTEIVALIGLTYYFYSKNKKLLENIENLSQRLDEQEDMVQKHEQVIMQLVQAVNRQMPPTREPRHRPSNSPKFRPQHTQRGSNTQSRKQSMKQSRKQSRKQKSPARQRSVSFQDNQEVREHIVEDNQSDLSENESALDAEIADELEELEHEGRLKKRV